MSPGRRADRGEHIDLPLGARHRFADIDRADHVVSKARSRLVGRIFQFLAQESLDLVRFAVDVGLRRRGLDGIGDHPAHVGKRGLPVAERHDFGRSDIGAAADIILADGGNEVAAAAARAIFQPAIDERLREIFEVEAPGVFDGIDALFPRPDHRERQRERLVRLDVGVSRTERHSGSDRRAFAEQLPCEQMRARRIGDALLRPILFAQLGQHDAALGRHRGIGDPRFAHHARQQFHAFVERRRCHAGQVELIDGLRRRRLRIRIAAEGDTETLPDALRLTIGNMQRAPECQMFEQMGKAAFAVRFEHRPDIHPHPDRHLSRRHAVVANGVAQAIGQHPEAPALIARNIAAFIEPVACLPRERRCGRRCRRHLRTGHRRHDQRQRAGADRKQEKRERSTRSRRGRDGHCGYLSLSNLAGH